MANYIPFQPVIFNEQTDECLLNTSNYLMPVQSGDKTQFQLKIEPCASSPDIVSNGNFSSSTDWSVGSNWAIAGNEATHTAGVGGTLTQNVPFTSSLYYRIIVGFSNITSGSCAVKCGLLTRGTVSADGVYEFEQSGALLGTGLNFVASSDFQGVINYVSVLVYKVDKLKCIIYDLQGNQQIILDNTDGYFSIKAPYLTVTIDWTALGLAYGCYYIGVCDECTNTCSQLYLAGDDWYNSNFWTKTVNNNATTTFTLSGNAWTYASTSGTGWGRIVSQANLCNGRTYKISYKVKGLTGDATVTPKCGTTSGTTRTTNGTYTDTIVSNGTTFEFYVASSTNPSGLIIYDFTFSGIESQLTSDYYSNKFSYKETWDCTKMISAVCNENSFGMGFNLTGFIPRVRVESKIILSHYPKTRVKTKDSLGAKKVDYFTGDKNWRLKILRVPEYVMDFLSLLTGFDHWYIDSDEFFCSEDEMAEPKPNKFFNVYDIDIECQKQTMQLVNKSCTDNTNSGTIDSQEVYMSSGNIVTMSTGVQVTLSTH